MAEKGFVAFLQRECQFRRQCISRERSAISRCHAKSSASRTGETERGLFDATYRNRNRPARLALATGSRPDCSTGRPGRFFVRETMLGMGSAYCTTNCKHRRSMKKTTEKPFRDLSPDEDHATEHLAGSGLGAASGAVAGGLIGSIGGPAAAVIGAAAGAVVGANAGFNAAEAVERHSEAPADEAQPDDELTEDSLPPKGADRSLPRDGCDEGGFSSEGQRQVLSADRK